MTEIILATVGWNGSESPEDAPRCFHATERDRLCPECLEVFLADPETYWQYGDHTDGAARWEDLMEEVKEWDDYLTSLNRSEEIFL